MALTDEPVTCPRCGGRGSLGRRCGDPDVVDACPLCRGEGVVTEVAAAAELLKRGRRPEKGGA